MSTPAVPAQNWTQFNFVDGDTFQVIEKQNGFNASLEVFQTAINNMVAALNEDVAFVEQARQELDAANIVHAPGSGLPNAAGEAYRRGVVGGSANTPLMAQGFGGLGILPLAPNPLPLGDDLNLNHPSGTYTVTSSTANNPLGSGVVRIDNRGFSLGEVTQTHISASTQNPQKHTRSRSSGIWTPFIKDFNQRNIIGTVMEAFGFPSGDIIETGSTPDGRYFKFAGRLMLCFQQMTLTDVATFEISGTWFFPRPFTGILHADFMMGDTGFISPTAAQLGVSRRFPISGSQVTFRQARTTGQTDFSTGDALPISCFAIGLY